MSDSFDDLGSLYRAARRDEEPTRADRRAVRTAIVGASAAAVTFHTTTAAGKLVALIPGGAKVLTLGQVVVYASFGVALGGGLAAVGATMSPTPSAVSAQTISVTRANHSLVVPAAVATAHPAVRIEAQAPNAEASQMQPQAPVQATTMPNHQMVRRSDSAALASVTPLASSAISATQSLPSVAQPNPGAPPSLMEESRALAAVQSAMGAHDTNRALQLLDIQDRDFQGGSLGPERAAARVLALCTVGRSAEALAAKKQFVAAYPGSPLMRRIQATCKK